jgi:transcriptional regulator with XRE-family HTH domain
MANIPIHPDMLRQAREALRLSQGEMADKLGVTRTWVGLLERGVRAPGIETLDKLAPVVSKKQVEAMIVSDVDRATFRGRYVPPPASEERP